MARAPEVAPEPFEPDDRVQTVFDCFQAGVRRYGNLRFLGARARAADGTLGEFVWHTYDEINFRVRIFGTGLHLLYKTLHPQRHMLGIHAQVIILAPNSVEWMVADLACMAYSLVTVPLQIRNADDLRRALTVLEPSVIICSREWTTKVIRLFGQRQLWEQHPQLLFLVQMEPLTCKQQVLAQEARIALYDFAFVEEKGRRSGIFKFIPPLPTYACTMLFRWHSISNLPTPLTINHASLVQNANALAQAEALGGQPLFTSKDRHLSHLPMAYVGERVILILAMRSGASVAIFQPSQQRLQLFDEMRIVKPTLLLSIPELFAIPFSTLVRVVERNWDYWAGSHYKELRHKWRGIPLCTPSRFWDVLVFNALANSLGGRLKRVMMLGDSANCSVTLEEQDEGGEEEEVEEEAED